MLRPTGTGNKTLETGTDCICLAMFYVRLQDCVFLKEPGYAETNWHSDLRMAPLDTNDFVTAWIPLRPVQRGEDDSG
jgi:ectoine hydroxylase-related dioxygenase (phytanoyl-CoA dioxygenase family)